MLLQLDYRYLFRWQVIVLTTVLIVGLYQGISYLHPANQEWIGSQDFSWGNLLYFLLVDQMLIECISVLIIVLGIRYYAQWLRYDSIEKEVKSIGRYLLKFLPLWLVIYFCFAPFTLSMRYLLHYLIRSETPDYFQHYFFLKPSLYLTYLPFTLLVGWGLLLYNFYKNNSQAATESKAEPQYLLVQEEMGEKPLPIQDIWWIKREERKYRIKTPQRDYYIRTTLKALEEQLPSPAFLRINRAVIIQCSQIKSYAYWENDKYVLRSQDGEEFVVSRQRLKKIKHLLAPEGQ